MSKQQSHIAFSGLCRLFPCRTPYGLLFALTVFLGFIIVWVFSLCSFWYWHSCDALFLKKKDELLLVILATTGTGVLLLETQEEEKQCKNFWKLVGSVAVSIVAFQAFLPYIFELKVITLIALIPAMVLMAGGSLAIINGMGLRLSILLLLGLISCWVPIVILYHEEIGISRGSQWNLLTILSTIFFEIVGIGLFGVAVIINRSQQPVIRATSATPNRSKEEDIKGWL